MSAPVAKRLLGDLLRVRHAVPKDPSRPAIYGVQFVLGDDDYQLVATDGFRLAVAGPDRLEPSAEATVSADDLPTLIAFLRSARRSTVALSVEDGTLVVERYGATLRLAHHLGTGFAPKWREVLARYRPADDAVSYRLDYLGDAGRAVGGEVGSLTIVEGEEAVTRPAYVVAPRYREIVMDVKVVPARPREEVRA